MRDWVKYIKATLAVIIVLAVFFGFVIVLVIAAPSIGQMTESARTSQHETTNTPKTKEPTMIVCNWFGVSAKSRISEMAAEGYEYAGPVESFLCGERGMLFILKETEEL